MAESPSGSESAGPRTYSESQTRAWLMWLAKNLERHGEVVFMVERLQPTWLQRRQRVVYWVVFSVILGLLLGAILWAGWEASEAMWESGDVHSPFEFLILTPLWVLLVGSLEGRRLRARWRHRPKSRGEDLWNRFWDGIRDHVHRIWEGFQDYVLWLAMFLIVWPALTWLALKWLELTSEGGSPVVRLIALGDLGPLATGWMGHPILAGFMMVVLYEVRVRTLADPGRIQPVEELGRSRRRAVVGFVWGLGLALLMWTILGVGTHMGSAGDPSMWSTLGSYEVLRNFFIYLPMGSVGGAIVGGLRPRMLKKKTEPAQGISLSWRNGRRAALWAALLLGVVFWAGITLPVLRWPDLWESRDGHYWAVVCVAFIAGIAAFLWYGGLDVLRHRILRRRLAAEGKPLDLVPFLDYATRLHFLQRVGGGYIFVHRYLMEHFAEMDEQEDGTTGSPG